MIIATVSFGNILDYKYFTNAFNIKKNTLLNKITKCLLKVKRIN